MSAQENEKNSTVPFNEQAVKAYLDEQITYWRVERAARAAAPEAEPDFSSLASLMHGAAQIERDAARVQIANCYVDAFQSVRASLFGESKA